VNRPSIISLIPDHGWRNLCHTQSCKQNWQGRKFGKKERRRAHVMGDHGRELEKTMEMQGVMNTKRRRVTFILDYFPVSGEGE
jgi:hypothetical protein